MLGRSVLLVSALPIAFGDPGELHCCFAPEGRPVVLACEATEDDRICSVPFAAYGDASEGPWTCGHDVGPTCGSNVTDVVAARCVGKRECHVSLTGIGFPCPDASKEMVVRWTCCRDGVDTPAKDLPPLPLRVQDGVIVDAHGDRVRLTGVNWAGAHIVNVPAGLDRAPVRAIARLIRKLGFNVVRLTWSVESVLSNPVVDDRLVAANPELQGRRALDVLDAVVTALQAEGVLVWPDCHMLDTDWCCHQSDCNGLWFNANHSVDDWVAAIGSIAGRYASYPAVVGMGLRNELRAVCGGLSWGVGEFCNASFFDTEAGAHECVEVGWASGPEALRYQPAVEKAGAAALSANPRLLVSVGGFDFATNLRPMQESLAALPKSQVVYEAHEYPWFTTSRHASRRFVNFAVGDGTPRSQSDATTLCKALGDVCDGITCGSDLTKCTVGTGQLEVSENGEISFVLKYGQDFSNYSEQLDYWWGGFARDRIAPVFVTEFGMAQDFLESAPFDPRVKTWFDHWSKYLQDAGPLADRGGLDWAYWEISGEQVGGTSRKAGSTETFGVLNHCWTAPANELHFRALSSLMEEPSEWRRPHAERGRWQLMGASWWMAALVGASLCCLGLGSRACLRVKRHSVRDASSDNPDETDASDTLLPSFR